MKRFLAHLLAMAAPAPLPIIEALPEDAEEADTQGTDAKERAREKERLRAILNCEQAKGRSRLALYLATDTDLSPEVAQSILDSADREATDAPKASGKLTAKEVNAAQCSNFFEQHRAQNPELWNAQPPLSVAETIARITHNYAAVAGLDVTPK